MSARRKCCVIGGAGFIGSALTPLLVQSGREVVVLGRRTAPQPQPVAGATYVSGDYADRGLLKELLQECSEIVDLAYSTIPKTSFADPVFDIVSNLPPSVGLLLEAASLRLRKVVMVSSGGTIYGVASRLPIAEDHPTAPISPYGITKLTVEKYAWMFHRISDMPIVVARPGNAYGENQRGFSGQGFIAAAMHAVMAGRPIDVYGARGTVRDYVHVDDVASGILASLDHGVPGQAYNVGTGTGHSNVQILQMLEPLARKAGLQVQVRTLPARNFDVPANVLDSGKLCAISGWQPSVALRDGLPRMWEALLAQSHAQAAPGAVPAGT